MSCINTSYSRLDEVEVTGVEIDLIVGQFAHHGEAFYRNEVKRTKELLVANERDFVARNDLASAYIKLKMYTEAEQEFMTNESYHPGQYETAANFGVLYKKMGKYVQAAGNIRRSLEVKPEGHMGLGDYYLRMIEWLGLMEQDPTYDKNFLAIPYSDPAEGIRVNKVVDKEYLMTLIKNDYRFADVYLVLGDVFLSERDEQLALRCYYRAIYLDHSRSDVLYARVDTVMKRMESMKAEGQIVDVEGIYSQMDQEFVAAEDWLEKYQDLEAQRLGKGQAVDFKTMKEALQAAGIEKPRILEAALYEGEEKSGFLDRELIFISALVAVVMVVILFFLNDMRRKKKLRQLCVQAGEAL